MAIEDPYIAIARHGPTDVRLGGALITMIEPNPGHERAYNRWYEDDHFYAGARSGPWCFAGRRWVAPWDLRRLRIPRQSSAVQPIERGCYVSTYWLTAGHVEDHIRWAHGALEYDQRPHGRTFAEREDGYTAWHDLAFTIVPGDGPLRPEHALDHPYGGLVLELVDPSPQHDRAAVHTWLRHEHLARRAEHSAVGQVAAFVPRPFPVTPSPGMTQPEGLDYRTSVLTFLTCDPREGWEELFAGGKEAHDDGGVAVLRFAAGFIPTVHGTHRHVDELREPSAVATTAGDLA
jgi:hypothetical protein